MRLLPSTFATSIAVLTSALTANAATILGNTADTSINSDPTVRAATAADEVIRRGTTEGRVFVFVFQLPLLGAVENPFQDATFSFSLLENGGNSVPLISNGNPAFTGGLTPTFALDLYGLGRRSDAAVLAGDFYSSATPDATDATLLAAGYVTSATAVGTVTSSVSMTSLNAYLNAQYANGLGEGQFVFLRLNPNADAGSSINEQRYRVSTANNTATTYQHITPQLNYIPEPSTGLALLGGASLLGLIRRRK
jgi:hypothetical protein